eukprot:c6833_g1_i1 orf=2-583(-)
MSKMGHKMLLNVWYVVENVVKAESMPDKATLHGNGHYSNGSMGTLFVVLVVIVVLGLLAGLLARLCNGRHRAGNLDYDFEGWVEKKCASCIDGSISTVVSPPTMPTQHFVNPSFLSIATVSPTPPVQPTMHSSTANNTMKNEPNDAHKESTSVKFDLGVGGTGGPSGNAGGPVTFSVGGASGGGGSKKKKKRKG